MKKIFLLLWALVSTYASYGQEPVDTSWKKGGFIGLNFSQINLSQWAPGGQNSIALGSSVNLFANYADEKKDWSNSLDLAYAMIKSASENARKSDDKMELNSKYGRKLSPHWLYSFLLNFKSQFAPGYNYPDDSTLISDFFSPAYLTMSAGFTYKPVEYFEVMISPATAKFTFVTNEYLNSIGAYGVDTGRTTRSEFGAYLNIRFKKDIMTNVNLSTRLELFTNYTDKIEDNRGKVDVNWETSLNMKINEYLTASITTNVVYDANVIERTQFKEVLAIGLGIKF